MLKEKDPRVGLSIDSSSQSCASDLSDSESSWDPDDYAPFRTTQGSLPDGSSWNSGENNINSSNNNNHNHGNRRMMVSDVPRTASFRSRLLPQRQRRQTAGSWDDDVRITQHPRAPSLRFCLTLCTLTLVLLSLTSNTATSHPSAVAAAAFEGGIRQQEQVHVPILSSKNEKSQTRRAGAQLQTPNYGPDAGHGGAASSNGGSEPPIQATGTRLRANLAMARPAQQRPIFGAQAPQLEQFLDRSADSNVPADRMVASNWHSWLAAVALVAMLLETGYKEYRRCRIMQEEQRRL